MIFIFWKLWKIPKKELIWKKSQTIHEMRWDEMLIWIIFFSLLFCSFFPEKNVEKSKTKKNWRILPKKVRKLWTIIPLDIWRMKVRIWRTFEQFCFLIHKKKFWINDWILDDNDENYIFKNMENEYFTIFFYLFIHDNSVKKKLWWYWIFFFQNIQLFANSNVLWIIITTLAYTKLLQKKVR